MLIAKRAANIKDLPTCVADMEQTFVDGNAIVADFHAGNNTGAILELEGLVTLLEKMQTDCGKLGYKKSMWITKRAANIKDLPTCIADMEQTFVDGNAIVADFHSGNDTGAILEMEALVTLLEKTHTDCGALGYKKSMWIAKRVANLKDKKSCIADINRIIADGKIITADFKAHKDTAAA